MQLQRLYAGSRALAQQQQQQQMLHQQQAQGQGHHLRIAPTLGWLVVN